jgi:hypothetical protein
MRGFSKRSRPPRQSLVIYNQDSNLFIHLPLPGVLFFASLRLCGKLLRIDAVNAWFQAVRGRGNLRLFDIRAAAR